MNAVDSLIAGLTADDAGLVDIKFFPGELRNVSMDRFAEEVCQALTDVSNGRSRRVDANEVDGHIEQVSVKDWLGQFGN